MSHTQHSIRSWDYFTILRYSSSETEEMTNAVCTLVLQSDLSTPCQPGWSDPRVTLTYFITATEATMWVPWQDGEGSSPLSHFPRPHA